MDRSNAARAPFVSFFASGINGITGFGNGGRCFLQEFPLTFPCILCLLLFDILCEFFIGNSRTPQFFLTDTLYRRICI